MSNFNLKIIKHKEVNTKLKTVWNNVVQTVTLSVIQSRKPTSSLIHTVTPPTVTVKHVETNCYTYCFIFGMLQTVTPIVFYLGYYILWHLLFYIEIITHNTFFYICEI